MDMLKGLLGYGGFILSLLAIVIVGYWEADALEAWATRRFKD